MLLTFPTLFSWTRLKPHSFKFEKDNNNISIIIVSSIFDPTMAMRVNSDYKYDTWSSMS